jgi:predicted permease
MRRESNLMETFVQTLRHALRRLFRSPGFAAVAILSLALGIGANTAVFTLVKAVFLQDPGIREPERVVQIYRVAQTPYWAQTWGQYERIRDELPDVLTHVTAFRPTGVRVGESDEVVNAILVSGDYFGVMGVPPLLGRAFLPGEETDRLDGPSVVVLSHDYWTRAFAADPAVVGSEVRVNARPHTVVGVLPPNFTGKFSGIVVDVFLPDPGAVASPGADMLFGGARLRDDVSVEQLRARLASLAVALNEGRPESLRRIEFTVVPETEVSVAPGFDEVAAPIGGLLFAVVGVVLLIACTNVASFLLARATDRRKELALRVALGASRGRVTAQLLTEALLLALLGGAGGVAVAYLGLIALVNVRVPLPLAVRIDVAPDLRVLGFTLAAAVAAALMFGLAPALFAARADVAPTLRDESGGQTGSRRRFGLRSSLVTAQVAMSLLLLMGSGLFLRSFTSALRVDPGYDPTGVAVLNVEPETTGYDEEEGRQLYPRLLEQVRALPGVTHAALGTRVPLQLGNWRIGARPPEMELPEGQRWLYPQVVYVSSGYFDALGIRVLGGRDFNDEDARGAPPAVVVNEAAAERFWGAGSDPVGRALLLDSSSGEEARVVGLARNSKLKTVGEVTEPVVYVPVAQQYSGETVLIARGSGSEDALASELRRVAKGLDPNLYVHGAMSARDASGLAFYLPRMGALLLGLFGVLGLAMASIGLYGVVSYAVARRQREVGIRLSLGARSDDVVRLMMRGGLRLALAGLGVGLVAAAAAAPLVERFLIGVPGLDPATFVVVPLVLLGVAALAAWLPARRAARIQPSITLRSE